MIISLSPYAPLPSELPLTVSVAGDVLTVNGVPFDFTQLAEGASLPAAATGSDLFVGTVDRVGGVLQLTLRLPHGPHATQAALFPQPIYVTTDGPVELPQ